MFLAASLHSGPGLLIEHGGRQVADELLAPGEGGVATAVGNLGAGGDGRAQVLLLGMVLGALEARTPKDAWRSAANGFRPTPGAVEYLHFLAANGYSLAPIEQVIIGERDAEQVYQEATAVTT